MEKRSEKRLTLENALANNYQKVNGLQDVNNLNPCLNGKTEHQQNFDNIGNKMDIVDFVKLCENGEYTQVLDQILSVQKRFIYFYSTNNSNHNLNRGIRHLFKSELTKVVDIRSTYNNNNFGVMEYYERAPIIYPQMLAQLCPNIIEFCNMKETNLSHVAFLNAYKKNVCKYEETEHDYTPKNKFSGYMDLFVDTMPHLIELFISKIGVDGVKVMMEAFGCKQENVDAVFNLVKEFKIKIDDTYFTHEQRQTKLEETISLLLKCPNTKTVDISLKSRHSSPIVEYFNSMPSSFTQAFAQLCPRIEQISVNGNLIFDLQLFASYARGTNGRCNMSHLSLLRFGTHGNYSEMQLQQQYYIDSCHKFKTLELLFYTGSFLIEYQSIEPNKNLLDKLKHVEDMKISGIIRLNDIAFLKQFMLMLTELKHLYFENPKKNDKTLREIYTTINSLPSLTSVELNVADTYCLELIRPSLIKNLSVRYIRPEAMNLFTSLYNLQSLTFIWANNDIIPIVNQLNSTKLFHLKYINFSIFYGDRKQLFIATSALSQTIKFDFYESSNVYGMKTLRDIIDARHTIFNKIVLKNGIIDGQSHVILHEAFKKLDSTRVKDAFDLFLSKTSMNIVQQCYLCQRLLAKNSIFHIYEQ